MARDIASGETFTVEAGTTRYGSEVNLAGQMDLAGEYRVFAPPVTALSASLTGALETTATPDVARLLSADLTGELDATATANFVYTLHRNVEATITYDETEEITLD